MISFSSNGDFSKTIKFLNNSINSNLTNILNRFGEEGVRALRKNTPVDSGSTANSWSYKVSNSKGKATISWFNTNVINGVPIAIILQYGHGTQNGGWIEGRDYINPAMKPVFDKLAEEAWKEVTK